MKRCWTRKEWQDKKEVNRILRLRAQEPANKDIDWDHCDDLFDVPGAVYAIYHFTSGRWYVGQTVNAVHKRAQGQWLARLREDDAFH